MRGLVEDFPVTTFTMNDTVLRSDRGRRLLLVGGLLAILIVLAIVLSVKNSGGSEEEVLQNHGLMLIQKMAFPTGYRIFGTEFGGISAISYVESEGIIDELPNENNNSATARLFALSDSRSIQAPPRFYEIHIEIDRDGFKTFQLIAVHKIDVNGYTKNQTNISTPIDPEGLTYDGVGDVFYWSDERFLGENPTVHVMSLNGTAILPDFDIPSYYAPKNEQEQGVRNNRGFESLTLSTDGQALITVTEQALIQDSSSPSIAPSPCRILFLNVSSQKAVAEYLYPLSPPSFGRGLSGVTDIVAVNTTHYLTIERSSNNRDPPRDFEINLFLFSLTDATNILGQEKLPKQYEMVKKSHVANISDGNYGDFKTDNVEGITFGPKLAGDKRTLILVSDNNFERTQETQFLLFSINL